MNDERSGGDPAEKSWLDKISQLFTAEPRNRDDLEDVLTVAAENEVIDEDARSIMEGAMQVLSLIHISEPTRPPLLSRMPSSA